MNQAKVIDIHKYYRRGGVDWQKIRENGIDAVIISAGVGMSSNPLLQEQIDGAVNNNVPFMTYHIPSPSFSMIDQVDFYLDLYGVRSAWTSVDVEPPGPGYRCINADETLTYIRRISAKTGRDPLIYSNPKYIVEALRTPLWLVAYKLWLAQWLYEYWWLRRKYTLFDNFLDKQGQKLPPFIRGKPFQSNTILWQFSDKGIAQKYCASQTTLDPKYPLGIRDADLNVSVIDKADFLDLLDVNFIPPPPDPSEEYRITVSDRNVRDLPSTAGSIVDTLHLNDKVWVSSIVQGNPGLWGRVTSYEKSGAVTILTAWIYMASLTKIGD